MSGMWVRRAASLGLIVASLAAISLARFGYTDEVDDRPPAPPDVIPGEAVVVEEGGNPALRAVGGLGVEHIQSTLGLIGVTADAYAKEVYTPEKVTNLMDSTITGIESVKKLLRKLQDTKLSVDDEEIIDRMIGAYNALQREATALSTLVKTKKPSDADAFSKARKTAIEKIDQLTADDDLPSPKDAGNSN
ncbi:MAG: hypothetical protein FJ267_01835 [Planctomycetes bacterium]|nr:hypothetical protein [Planctomycetota bacterium]